jgi:hypothetical protein
MLKKIISGGQTGADRAALDAAIESGCEYGGAIPKGRLTETGTLDAKYQLTELHSPSYPERTKRNVVDGDGTVIISHGKLTGGSFLTRTLAVNHKRPCLHLDVTAVGENGAVELLAEFIKEHCIEVLNVAGPRASGDPDIYEAVLRVMSAVLKESAGNYPAPPSG